MKKYLFIAATAIVALASCSEESMVTQGTETPVNSGLKAITFNSSSAATTRADYTGGDAATLLGNNFVVEGVKWNGGSSTKETVYDHYNVNYVDGTANTTTSNSAGWEYVGQTKHAHATIAAQSIKYWDYAKSQYDFIAYSVGTATADYSGGTYDNTKVQISQIDVSNLNGVDETSPADGIIDVGAYTIKGKASELAKVYIADMKTAYRDGEAANDALGDYNNVVQFKFRSLSAKVRIALYETVPGYSVNNVEFYTDASTVATDSKAHLYTTGTDVFNEEGTYVVYYPTTGSANKSATDYNKAHLAFHPVETTGTSQAKAFGALDATNTFVGEEVNEDGDATSNETDKLYIGRSSNEASYAGNNAEHHYTVVIPNETGAVLNLKVNYTLVSTDGSGEVINVTGATAQVPAQFASWKSGYAYTYIFKISQNTNGVTNPSAGPAGLYPITFDAVVTETEDGIQETITTVSTPSITTYAKGAMVTANNEYLTGANIYAFVDNGTALTVGTNANLYTVTLEDDAAQTINEASVANAIAQGGTVTDANGKTMTVTAAAGLTAIEEIAAADSPNGNAMSINGVKFTPAAPTFTAVTSGTVLSTTGTPKYYTKDENDVYTEYTVSGTVTAEENQYFTKTASSAGIYVFEYINGTYKYYKIIKVVDQY